MGVDDARCSVSDAADPQDVAVPDARPSPAEYAGPWPDAPTSEEWARMYPELADVFSRGPAPAEDRIF